VVWGFLLSGDGVSFRVSFPPHTPAAPSTTFRGSLITRSNVAWSGC
jgi:hypothetical protein